MTIRLALAGTLAAAFALRVRGLSTQSLWYDEGTSAAMAGRSLVEIVARSAADIHPPLYYLLLAAWTSSAGPSEYALRYFSASAALLALAATIALARQGFGPRVAVLAGVAASVNPLSIWYAQEARMYALGSLFVVLAALLALRLGRSNNARYWLGLVGLAVATAYTHYVAIASFAAQLLALLPRFTVPIWRARAFVALILVLIAYEPWWSTAWRQVTGWPSPTSAESLPTLVQRTGAALWLGVLSPTNDLLWTTPLAWSIVVVGLLRMVRGGGAGTIVGLSLLVPIAAIVGVSSVRPFFHPKFLVSVAPFIDIALGVGLAWLYGSPWARPLPRVMVVLLAIGMCVIRLAGFASATGDPATRRDEYRGLAAYLMRVEAPGDVVLVSAPGQVEILRYYYRGEAPLIEMPVGRPAVEDATVSHLEAVTVASAHVRGVLWSTGDVDPNRVLENWLDRRMFKSSDRWFGGVRLVEYLNPAVAGEQKSTIPVDEEFVGVGRLASVEVSTLEARAGGTVPIALQWIAAGSTARPLAVFVHLIDEQDYLWGQRDSEPGGGLRPTTTWVAGVRYTDRVGLPILRGTPSGELDIEIGLYDPSTGLRVRTTSGSDHVRFGRIAVRPDQTGLPPDPRMELWRDLGGAILAGVDLHRLGEDDGGPTLTAGEIALLSLHFVGKSPSLHLREARVTAVSTVDGQPVRTWLRSSLSLSPEALTPGMHVRLPMRLTTEGLPPGAYRLDLALRGEQGTELRAADVARLGVRG
ncbi:MAG: hypothetical protein FJ033_10820 [Chloroflexi bacterium]|nr:hypothetical protein [Chloroflexota bacterium]